MKLIFRQNHFQNIAADDEFIFLKVEYQWVRISLKDICYIESLKDYVKVHLEDNQKAILSLISLKALEEKLPSAKFMRVHRSFIVRLDKIASIDFPNLYLEDEKKMIPIGGSYREELSNRINMI